MTHGSEWDMEIWRPEVENVTRGRMSHEQLCVICFVVWLTTTTTVAKCDWVWDARSSAAKNTHSPNYCSSLAICVNYSANFYCKIALISRFKVYLIKMSTVTSKRKQKQRRIYLVNVTWLVVIIMTTGRPWHGNHLIMLDVTWRRFDQSVKQLVVGRATI